MANTITAQELKALLDKHEDLAILDVRLRRDYEADPSVIPGAKWHDPEELEDWDEAVVPAGKKAVVYCLKGGALSTLVTDFLQKRNVESCYLQGGITAWKKEVLGEDIDEATTCGSCCLPKN